MQEYYLKKPDFIYKKARIAIFCDGSVHDSPEQQQRDHEVPRLCRDRLKRENLESVTGYMAVSIDYQKNLLSQLEYIRSLI